MDQFKKGYVVAVILAVLTVVEYVFAVEVASDAVRFGGLAATSVAKCWMIAAFFMHFARMWRTGEAH